MTTHLKMKKNMFKSLDQGEESFAGCWLTMNQFLKSWLLLVGLCHKMR